MSHTHLSLYPCSIHRVCRHQGQLLKQYHVLTAYQEMTNGASEAASIEHFGKRCRQLSYLRYASIINQNMKKGTEGYIALLEAEAADAFEKRKEWSRQLGETAGTKLLLPMMLMFGIVISIIIMPAFMAM